MRNTPWLQTSAKSSTSALHTLFFATLYGKTRVTYIRCIKLFSSRFLWCSPTDFCPSFSLKTALINVIHDLMLPNPIEFPVFILPDLQPSDHSNGNPWIILDLSVNTPYQSISKSVSFTFQVYLESDHFPLPVSFPLLSRPYHFLSGLL